MNIEIIGSKREIESEVISQRLIRIAVFLDAKEVDERDLAVQSTKERSSFIVGTSLCIRKFKAQGYEGDACAIAMVRGDISPHGLKVEIGGIMQGIIAQFLDYQFAKRVIDICAVERHNEPRLWIDLLNEVDVLLDFRFLFEHYEIFSLIYQAVVEPRKGDSCADHRAASELGMLAHGSRM